MKKTSKYTKEDWARINGANEQIYGRVIDNMDKGIGNPEVQKAVAVGYKQILGTVNNY